MKIGKIVMAKKLILKKKTESESDIKPEETIQKTPDPSKILAGLNPSQKEAVESINGPLLVIAGAGSGKTRVLTHRTAYLIEKGVKPWSILCLTFTNKAANEMKQRIAKIVSKDAAQQIWAGTFHSIFARILRKEAPALGYTSSFSIYDTEDSLRLVKSIMYKIGLTQKEYPPSGMRSRISGAKNNMTSWQQYSHQAASVLEKQTALVFRAYEEALKNNNAMDFDDLLLNMIAALKASEETLKYYQRRFRYLLVDEYQDTNRAQYIAVKMLAAGYKNLCVVGDDAQSIYRWRGADIKNILDFQKDYDNAKTIRLEQNYRSTKTIIEAAGSVIKNNRKQIPKKLWTDNVQGEKIKVFSCSDERFEAERIVSLINENLKKDYTLKDLAILYRTNAQSLSIENSLRQAQLPYVIVGGLSFYKRKEVKDAMAYLRLFLNRKDSESLVRIVNEPPRGLGQVSIGHIARFADENNIPLYQAFERIQEVPAFRQELKNRGQFCKYL